MPGTQQELEERVKNFEQHRQQQNDRRRQEENRRLDLEEEIHNLRGVQEALIEEIGQLSAEEKVAEFIPFQFQTNSHDRIKKNASCTVKV